jgi:hypothetical protein
MMTKSNATSTEIQELTRAEIARQVATHVARRQQIIEERAKLFSRSAGAPPSPLSPNEAAARAHAKRLLSGHAPPSLEPSGLDFSSLDQQLCVEQRGIDIVIKILSDNDLLARAAEAVQWAESHASEWHQLVRETIVTAARLEALERAAARMIEKCVDVSAINLPMLNMIGHRQMFTALPGFSGYVDVTADDLIEAGLKAGVVTKREIEKAKNVARSDD